MSEKTNPETWGVKCGDCFFWRRLENGVVANLREKLGECYESPPVPYPVPTSQGMAVVVLRPQVADVSPACGRFADTEDGDIAEKS